MTDKHTPGPWHWGKDPKGYLNQPCLLNSEGKVVCDFGDDTEFEEYCGSAPNNSDMALIRTSPELLEALEKCLSCLDEWGIRENPDYFEARDKARSAIQKARG